MSAHKIDQDQGAQNRNRVLAEVLRRPGLLRTDIGRTVVLNVASVSRITRDLIDSGLISEKDAFGPKGRPGRRFVGLNRANRASLWADAVFLRAQVLAYRPVQLWCAGTVVPLLQVRGIRPNLA